MSTAPSESAALVEQLSRYIDVDSTSERERDYLELLEADLTARGYRVERQPVADARWNLVARPSGEPELLFATHVDCVPPHIPARVADGRVWGRGACDTKGGLVAMMAAADRVDPRRQRLGFLLVVGEEVDHIGAEVARSLELEPRAIILCEPTRGHLIQGQKGMLKLVLESHGEAAHSAFPELGRDALGPLLDSLERIRRAELPRDPVLGPTTVNIGVLRAGVAANITPPGATAELMVRVVSDLDTLEAQLRNLCDERVTVRVASRNPVIRLPVVPGFPTDTIAFNTDAYYLRELGPVVLMGPGDIRVAHGDREHIAIDDLVAGADAYAELARTLLESGLLGDSTR